MWYEKNARKLPWRDTRDPYRIWISEVMLQQTTVAAVTGYYEHWMRKFPVIQKVATASEQRILKAWQGLGYYRRAKNIHKTAKFIHHDYRGVFPGDPHLLRRLPGFGDYTAGAVASIAFNVPAVIVDANIRRVVSRLLALRDIGEGERQNGIREFLKSHISRRRPGDFNQALMELGAVVCRKKNPLCNLCPIKSTCQAYDKNIQEIIPETKKRMLKPLNVALGVLRKANRVYIQRRPSAGLLADLWEFPGGKIRKGESGRNALIREFKEELGISLIRPRHMLDVKHYYTQYAANLMVWECRSNDDPMVDDCHRWVSLKEIIKYPMPSGSAKIVDYLRSGEGRSRI